MQQGFDPARRVPKQARARDTVAVIFEATARILEREGRVGFTTNRVAERAGISIGTLYEYFPNKQAILAAMTRREAERVAQAVMAVLAEPSPEPSLPPERRALRAFLDAFDRRYRLRCIALEAMSPTDLLAPVEEFLRQLAHLNPAALPPVDAFILAHAVVGAIRAAILGDSPLLGTPEFEAALARLIRAYMVTSE